MCQVCSGFCLTNRLCAMLNLPKEAKLFQNCAKLFKTVPGCEWQRKWLDTWGLDWLIRMPTAIHGAVGDGHPEHVVPSSPLPTAIPHSLPKCQDSKTVQNCSKTVQNCSMADSNFWMNLAKIVTHNIFWFLHECQYEEMFYVSGMFCFPLTNRVCAILSIPNEAKLIQNCAKLSKTVLQFKLCNLWTAGVFKMVVAPP